MSSLIIYCRLAGPRVCHKSGRATTTGVPSGSSLEGSRPLLWLSVSPIRPGRRTGGARIPEVCGARSKVGEVFRWGSGTTDGAGDRTNIRQTLAKLQKRREGLREP